MGGSGKFFDGFADSFDTFYDEKRGRLMRWADRRYRSDIFTRFDKTFEALGDLHGKRVLDIGCGSGPYMAEALKRGAAHVTGIDPARRMLELARERLTQLNMADRATLIEGYFPKTDSSGSSDLSIVMGVMDYVEDGANFLKSLRHVTSEKAVISFPSNHWFRTPFRKFRYTIRRCPVYFYSPSIIQSLIQQAGFEKYEIEKIPGAGMDFIVCLYK